MTILAELLSLIYLFLDAEILSPAFQILAQASEENKFVFGIDMSIEGLRSQKYSYFIFGFLVASLILFCYIIYLYLPKKMSALKTGEKYMFGALIVGVILAIIIGWIQLIEGYLI